MRFASALTCTTIANQPAQWQRSASYESEKLKVKNEKSKCIVVSTCKHYVAIGFFTFRSSLKYAPLTPNSLFVVYFFIFNCALTPALLFSLKYSSFRCDVPQEQRVAYNISSPHSFRLFQQSVCPLQSMLLPPHRRTRHRTGKEVKYGTNRSHMAMYV